MRTKRRSPAQRAVTARMLAANRRRGSQTKAKRGGCGCGGCSKSKAATPRRAKVRRIVLKPGQRYPYPHHREVLMKSRGPQRRRKPPVPRAEIARKRLASLYAQVGHRRRRPRAARSSASLPSPTNPAPRQPSATAGSKSTAASFRRAGRPRAPGILAEAEARDIGKSEWARGKVSSADVTTQTAECNPGPRTPGQRFGKSRPHGPA